MEKKENKKEYYDSKSRLSLAILKAYYEYEYTPGVVSQRSQAPTAAKNTPSPTDQSSRKVKHSLAQ